ncbi:hypothetical protein GCM10009603_65430 [Nocardiopsis exhalans]
MRPLRRRTIGREAPPVPVPDVLPLYRALFPELGVSPDTPTVQLHAAVCEAATTYLRSVWPPAECACPEGFPVTLVTVADGWNAADEYRAMVE